MSLVTDTLRHLDDMRNHIAILDMGEVKGQYNTVFDFIADFQSQPSGSGFTARYAKPGDNPNGKGDELVLTVDPTNIREHENTGNMVFIVTDKTLIKKALLRYVIA